MKTANIPEAVYIENTSSSLIHFGDAGQRCQRCQLRPVQHSIMVCEPDLNTDELAAWAKQMGSRFVYSPEYSKLQVDVFNEPKSTFVWRKTWLVCVFCFGMIRMGLASLDEYNYE